MRITMIGHSTVLIETGGMRILTDPFFARVGNPAFRRIGSPSMTREELREVDLVLVSHLHWDHTDRKFLRALGDTPMVLPDGSVPIARLLFGRRNFTGLSPREERSYGAVTVTAVPAVHIASTVGFVIRAEGKHVYFAGDTYYGPFMKETGSRFQLDAALIPVFTYRLPMTMGEAGAVRAVADLHPAVVIPIHGGIAPRSPLLRTGQSAEGFRRRVAEAGLPTEVVMLSGGESREL